MGEGVSLSLHRNGFPVANLLVISVPFSREHGFYGKINLPNCHHFSRSFSIAYNGSDIPEVRMAIDTGAWTHKWSNEDINSLFSAYLVETDLSGVLIRATVG